GRRRLRPRPAGEGLHGRAGPGGRRLPEDVRGAVGQGRDLPAGAGGASLRRRGRDARRVRQLAGARGAPGVHPGRLRLTPVRVLPVTTRLDGVPTGSTTGTRPSRSTVGAPTRRSARR